MAVWGPELHTITPDLGGNFMVVLGSTTPISNVDPERLWLEVSVLADDRTVQLQPREHLLPSLYSTAAHELLPGTVTGDSFSKEESEKLNGHSLVLENHSLTSDDIADGSIRSVDLSDALRNVASASVRNGEGGYSASIFGPQFIWLPFSSAFWDTSGFLCNDGCSDAGKQRLAVSQTGLYAVSGVFQSTQFGFCGNYLSCSPYSGIRMYVVHASGGAGVLASTEGDDQHPLISTIACMTQGDAVAVEAIAGLSSEPIPDGGVTVTLTMLEPLVTCDGSAAGQ